MSFVPLWFNKFTSRQIKMSHIFRLTLLATLVANATNAPAETLLRNICRVKGQEENTLRGLGLVVGLNGTGEAGDGPTMRALARAMEIMGSPGMVAGRPDPAALDELKKLKNASLVMVTATVPPTGARRGDKLDCYVAAIAGKGIGGGRLAFAALQGPNTQDTRVFGLCQGHVQVDDGTQSNVGRVHNGCQMEQDVWTPFVKEGFITLVLDKNHADFQIASSVAEKIREQYRDNLDGEQADTEFGDPVRALDAANIQVRIPENYRSDPVLFLADMLDTKIYDSDPEARVTINPRAGSIVISGDVTIGDVIVSHKNVVVEADGAPPVAEFARIDTTEIDFPRLDRLVQQLSALKVPTNDVIEIIRGIDRNGKLHGRLIIE